MTANDKYVVFKRADFDAAAVDCDEVSGMRADAVPDAWVVRQQDAHAATAVYAYANAVQTTIEILSTVTPAEVKHHLDDLEKIRDAAFTFALQADKALTRLPD